MKMLLVVVCVIVVEAIYVSVSGNMVMPLLVVVVIRLFITLHRYVADLKIVQKGSFKKSLTRNVSEIIKFTHLTRKIVPYFQLVLSVLVV